MNLKITNIQISSYAEREELPTLQYLADKLCEDKDMEYVLKKSKTHANLDKIDVSDISSIYTKLKDYPYEFEINRSLQLASIDGVKISTLPENEEDTIISMTKAELKSMIASEVNLQLSNIENYTAEEQRIGTWVNGKPIYRKVFTGLDIYVKAESYNDTIDISDMNIDMIMPNTCAYSSNYGNWRVSYWDNKQSTDKLVCYPIHTGTINIIVLEYTKTTD